MGGKAQSAHVLSADVDRNENSFGCQRHDITLSWCSATTTLGKGMQRSPRFLFFKKNFSLKKIVSLTSTPLRHLI